MKNIKHLITLGSLLVSSFAFSQVVIEGTVGSAGTNTSVILDFPENQGKGIILPYLRDNTKVTEHGTIALDASIPEDARVKYYIGGGLWKDLSGDGAVITDSTDPLNTAAVINAALLDQPEYVNEPGATIIGDPSGTNNGVLVLNSTDKAMVLPIVSDYTDIKSPSPGMMVYINKAGAKRLAVFNGSKWSFWKP